MHDRIVSMEAWTLSKYPDGLTLITHLHSGQR
jgi:hypothetical protein